MVDIFCDTMIKGSFIYKYEGTQLEKSHYNRHNHQTSQSFFGLTRMRRRDKSLDATMNACVTCVRSTHRSKAFAWGGSSKQELDYCGFQYHVTQLSHILLWQMAYSKFYS